MPAPGLSPGNATMIKAGSGRALGELAISEGVTEAGRVLPGLLSLPGSTRGGQGPPRCQRAVGPLSLGSLCGLGGTLLRDSKHRLPAPCPGLLGW